LLQAAEAAEAETEVAACIGGIRMHQKSMEADRADGADGADGEYKVSEAVKAVVRTHQNPLGQDGTCLELLLLHVGPNGDRFCKGNLTILRRILYLDLAKGNPK
jgi:hypothetical protein